MNKQMTAASKRLRQMFRFYNKNYFDGKIEEPETIEFANTVKDQDSSGWCVPNVIQISKNLLPHEDLTAIVLLHEMAHLSVGMDYWPHHGMLYQAELVRLFNAGAYETLL